MDAVEARCGGTGRPHTVRGERVPDARPWLRGGGMQPVALNQRSSLGTAMLSAPVGRAFKSSDFLCALAVANAPISRAAANGVKSAPTPLWTLVIGVAPSVMG